MKMTMSQKSSFINRNDAKVFSQGTQRIGTEAFILSALCFFFAPFAVKKTSKIPPTCYLLPVTSNS